MYYENRLGGSYYQNQRDKVIKRDERCVFCGNKDANTAHHIIPRQEFDKEENAHTLDNLLLVCKTPCRWELEDMPKGKQREYIQKVD